MRGLRSTRIRHYGYLSPAAKRTRLKIRWLLGTELDPAPETIDTTPFACPHCGNHLKIICELRPQNPRAPPSQKIA